MANRNATLRDLYSVIPEALGQSTSVDVTFPGTPTGETLSIAGIALTGAASRTPGNNDFAPALSSLAAAVNDPTNSFYTVAIAKFVTDKVRLYSLSLDTPYDVETSDEDKILISDITLAPAPFAVGFALDLAQSIVPLEVWKHKTSEGQALLAAHTLALSLGIGGGEAGSVTQRKFKDIEEQYTQIAGRASDYGTTRFGRLFEALQATVFVDFGIVGGPSY